MTAYDDRARDEQPAVEVRMDLDGSLWRRLDTRWVRLMGSGAQCAAAPSGSVRLTPEQSAPTARETAADELTEAEEYQLTYALEIADRAASSLPMKTLAGAVRKRGRERDAARAEAEHLDAGYSRTLVSLDAARAEAERLRVQLTRAQALSSADPTAVRELRDENERLRTRVRELEPIAQRAERITRNRLRDSATRHVAHEILGEA